MKQQTEQQVIFWGPDSVSDVGALARALGALTTGNRGSVVVVVLVNQPPVRVSQSVRVPVRSADDPLFPSPPCSPSRMQRLTAWVNDCVENGACFE